MFFKRIKSESFYNISRVLNLMNFQKGSTTLLVAMLIPAITAGVFLAHSLSEVESASRENNFEMAEQVKAVYLTSWSASTEGYIDYVINLARETEVNTVVIDIKDWTGNIFYDTSVPQFEKYEAEKVYLPDIEALIQRFHEQDIGVIARIVVFQDPVLAEARPELALKSKNNKEKLWGTSNGLAWVDPASEEVWGYNIKLARDAFRKGFDEVNFDYVRFPSDGNLQDIKYPVWKKKTNKNKVISNFFQYVRKKLPNKRLSVDLFGLTTVKYKGLGVGQKIEDAFRYFDYVCPMVYPSHYSRGFAGFQNPGRHPYHVVSKSMNTAKKRLKKLKQDNQEIDSKLRPWLQDFDLEVEYDSKMVREEIRATERALGEDFVGFMLWSSENFYSAEALKRSPED